MSIKDTIKEAVTKYTVESILGLLSPLFVVVVLALKTQIAEHILPELSKPVLAGIVVMCISLLLLMTAYIAYLRKLRILANEELRTLKSKFETRLVPRFGILWSTDKQPHCPGCSKPLTGYELWNNSWRFTCVSCKVFVRMADDNGVSIALTDARVLLARNPL